MHDRRLGRDRSPSSSGDTDGDEGLGWVMWCLITVGAAVLLLSLW